MGNNMINGEGGNRVQTVEEILHKPAKVNYIGERGFVRNKHGQYSIGGGGGWGVLIGGWTIYDTLYKPFQ